MDHTYNNLQLVLQQYMTEPDIEYIHSVYLFTKNAHEGQIRKSGEPYIIHPIAVATILAEQKLSVSVIVSGLLHDVVEDTDYTYEQIAEFFTVEVADIVDGVTKLGTIKGHSFDQQQAENHRKIIVSAAKDIRVILVKLADRVHNMRTINFMNESKQKIIANETMEIYAPIAHRLGMYKIKWELEDLSFKVLNPAAYGEIAQKLAMKKSERDELVTTEIANLTKLIEDKKIDAVITGRSKHIYSIYRKMKDKNQMFEEITDLFAFRLIVKTIPDCYSVLGILHEAYKPVPMRFKDYIPTPKHNMYQSIHSTVIASGGQPIEVQIRTREMDEVAENGVASHWAYKSNAEHSDTQIEVSKRLDWLQKASEMQSEGINSTEFMSRLKEDHFSKSIFVFTPQGDIIELPEKSTVLDFAFYIHTDIAYTALSGKVNDNIVSLFYKLKIGDVVQVITSKHAKPSVEWIQKVKTIRAVDGLRKYFKNDQKRVLQNEGRRLLIQCGNDYGIEDTKELIDSDKIYAIMEKFEEGNKDNFLYLIGIGEIEIDDVIKVIKKQKTKPHNLSDIIIENVQHPYEYHYCKYCSPIPGDKIKAIKADNSYTNKYYIHREECYQPYATNKAIWTDNTDAREYKVRLNIEIKDQKGAILEVLQVITQANINISSIYARGQINKRGICRLSMFVSNLKMYKEVENKLKASDYIISVQRRIDKEEEFDENY